MSGVHGVFQHRTGYYYTVLEEDFCEVFKGSQKSEVCRAYIASIFEQLTNKQYDENSNNEDIWVFMSIPEMVRRMRNAYKERTIHKELQGMIEDGYLEKRRSHRGGATMEYKLNIKKIREELAKLPEKGIADTDVAKMQDQIDRGDVAKMQDQSGKNATLSCKNDTIDLAKMQPRVSRDSLENKREVSMSQNVSPTPPEYQQSITLSPEEKRIFDLFCQIEIRPNITSKVKAQCAKLAPDIRTLEDMKSLHAFALEKLGDVKNKRLFLGNLDGAVGAWKNKVLVPAGQSTPPRNYSDHKIDHHSDPWT